MNDVASPFQSPAILSFCSGTLGLERGIERVIGPVRTAVYVEIESFICENLVQQMEQGLLAAAPIFTNLKTFDPKPFRNKIHGITAGYPCQPFSVAGERKGEDDPRHLFPHLLKIVDTVRPVWCYFENVRGHLSMGYEQVYRSLREIGYSVECGIFSAAEAGATHERERLFILAIQLEYSNDNGYNGSQNRKGNRAGENYNTTREKTVIESQGSSNSGKRESMESEMADPHSQREQQLQRSVGESGGRIDDGGEELGYSESTESCQPIETRRGRRGTSIDGTEEMGNTSKFRSSSGLSGQVKRKEGIAGIADDNGSERWPAPPGPYQHEWEAPRLISPVGCTVNGYNFREDLLRALGNSVVEQTAEIAFRTLLGKFNIEIK